MSDLISIGDMADRVADGDWYADEGTEALSAATMGRPQRPVAAKSDVTGGHDQRLTMQVSSATQRHHSDSDASTGCTGSSSRGSAPALSATSPARATASCPA